MSESEARLRNEFEALAVRARLRIPDDRREDLFKDFLVLRKALDLLRNDLRSSDETASVFSLEAVLRTL